MNSFISIKEFELRVLKIPTKKTEGPGRFAGEFQQAFKKDIIQILHKYFQKKKGTHPNNFLL